MNEQTKKNAMKKKITFGLVAFAMVAASAVFMKSIAKDDLSAMIQANVDALTVFEWDGKLWNESDTHDHFTDWLPHLTTCQIHTGFPPYVVVTDGNKVICRYGNGNCNSATDCK